MNNNNNMCDLYDLTENIHCIKMVKHSKILMKTLTFKFCAYSYISPQHICGGVILKKQNMLGS